MLFRVMLCVMPPEEIQDDSDIEEMLERGSVEDGGKTKPRKVNPVGAQFYGERFVTFDKMDTLRDLIPAFKAHYYETRIRDPKISGKQIMSAFNEQVVFPMGRTFFPHMTNVKNWRAKWDLDIAEQRKEHTGEEKGLMIRPMSVKQVLKTRGDQGEIVLGGAGYNELEAGATTLAGELMNDAMQMLRDDQEIGEIYEDEVLIKRRNYIVNVFGHVTKLVHGKASLLLKASQEKRENASFLMTLLAKATAGKLSEEEMGSLRTTYTIPKSAETAQPQP